MKLDILLNTFKQIVNVLGTSVDHLSDEAENIVR